MFVLHRGPSVGHRSYEVFVKTLEELYIFVLIGYEIYSIVTYFRNGHDRIVTTGAGAVVTKSKS